MYRKEERHYIKKALNKYQIHAKLKNIAKFGIYICICQFFFVILRAEKIVRAIYCEIRIVIIKLE